MFWFGAIVSLCYVPGVTGALIATQWPVLSILLPFALWRSGPVTALHYVGLLFIGYATVRLWSTPIFADGVFGLWLVYIMCLSFWLGSTLDNLRSLYAGLAVGASVSSLIAVFQEFGYSVVPYVSDNPAGLYVNNVVQGIVLALVVVALVSERMWLWVPLLLPGLFLSHSRGAWIALAVGLLAVYVRRAWVFAILGIAGVFLLTRALGPSDMLRLFIWDKTTDMLTWWGWGPGSFFSWQLRYDSNNIYPEYAHNDALQLVFEYGIAAALPMVCIAYALSRTTEREWPVIVAFVAAGCYSMPLWVPLASFLACVAAGRIAGGGALVWSDGDRGGFHVLPRDRSRANRTGGELVPVVAGS